MARRAVVAVVALAALAALASGAGADGYHPPRRWVSTGFGLGFPQLLHWDVSVWPLRNVSIDGRMSIVLPGWGASAGGTVHIPMAAGFDVLLTGSYGMAKVDRIFSSGYEEYRIIVLGGGVGGRFDTWEWRGELGATRWEDVETSSEDWFPTVEFAFSMNFPRP